MTSKPRFKPNREIARAALAEWNLRDLFWDAAITADLNEKKRLGKAANIRTKAQPTDKDAMHLAGVLERRAREFRIRAELLRSLAERYSSDIEPNPKREAGR